MLSLFLLTFIFYHSVNVRQDRFVLLSRGLYILLLYTFIIGYNNFNIILLENTYYLQLLENSIEFYGGFFYLIPIVYNSDFLWCYIKLELNKKIKEIFTLNYLRYIIKCMVRRIIMAMFISVPIFIFIYIICPEEYKNLAFWTVRILMLSFIVYSIYKTKKEDRLKHIIKILCIYICIIFFWGLIISIILIPNKEIICSILEKKYNTSLIPCIYHPWKTTHVNNILVLDPNSKHIVADFDTEEDKAKKKFEYEYYIDKCATLGSAGDKVAGNYDYAKNYSRRIFDTFIGLFNSSDSRIYSMLPPVNHNNIIIDIHLPTKIPYNLPHGKVGDKIILCSLNSCYPTSVNDLAIFDNEWSVDQHLLYYNNKAILFKNKPELILSAIDSTFNYGWVKQLEAAPFTDARRFINDHLMITPDDYYTTKAYKHALGYYHMMNEGFNKEHISVMYPYGERHFNSLAARYTHENCIDHVKNLNFTNDHVVASRATGEFFYKCKMYSLRLFVIQELTTANDKATISAGLLPQGITDPLELWILTGDEVINTVKEANFKFAKSHSDYHQLFFKFQVKRYNEFKEQLINERFGGNNSPIAAEIDAWVDKCIPEGGSRTDFWAKKFTNKK